MTACLCKDEELLNNALMNQYRGTCLIIEVQDPDNEPGNSWHGDFHSHDVYVCLMMSHVLCNERQNKFKENVLSSVNNDDGKFVKEQNRNKPPEAKSSLHTLLFSPGLPVLAFIIPQCSCLALITS